jgi:hypothetical protein
VKGTIGVEKTFLYFFFAVFKKAKDRKRETDPSFTRINIPHTREASNIILKNGGHV